MLNYINGDLIGRTFFHFFNLFNHIIRVISATEVAINKEDKNICVNFLTFSAALGIARINSALHSLARKFVKFVGNKILWLNKFVQNYNEKATHSRHRADLLADNAN